MGTTRIQFLISSSADSLRTALVGYEHYATVEAEYGSLEVEGSSDLLSLNHHVRPERACPCSLSNERFDGVREEIEAVGLSHFDLDTLGGCMALLGVKPDAPAFWACAEWVDTRGPHRVRECSQYSEDTHVLLASFWAWSQANRLFPPRDGSVSDVTEFVSGAIEELSAILAGDDERLERGRQFLAAEDALKGESFVRDGVSESGLRVVLRQSDGFVNHLYYSVDDSPADVVVGYSTKFKSVTVSRATDDVSVVAREFVQSVFTDCQILVAGEESPRPEIYADRAAVERAAAEAGIEEYSIQFLAGGHPGIAGSPRGKELDFAEAERAFAALLAR